VSLELDLIYSGSTTSGAYAEADLESVSKEDPNHGTTFNRSTTAGTSGGRGTRTSLSDVDWDEYDQTYYIKVVLHPTSAAPQTLYGVGINVYPGSTNAHKSFYLPYLSFEWSSSASACFPDDNGVRVHTYRTGEYGYVATAGNSQVTLYCPIETLFSNETEKFYTNDGVYLELSMAFQGNARSGADPAYSRAELVRLDLHGGTETDLISMVSTSNSGLLQQSAAIDWTELDDTGSYAYYVKITMTPTVDDPTDYHQTVYEVWLNTMLSGG
jgi:hypothetical protein